jgi:hypothetical protein
MKIAVIEVCLGSERAEYRRKKQLTLPELR